MQQPAPPRKAGDTDGDFVLQESFWTGQVTSGEAGGDPLTAAPQLLLASEQGETHGDGHPEDDQRLSVSW